MLGLRDLFFGYLERFGVGWEWVGSSFWVRSGGRYALFEGIFIGSVYMSCIVYRRFGFLGMSFGYRVRAE